MGLSESVRRIGVEPDVQLHAEVPLLALAGLVHLRISRLVGVLGRTGGADQRGVHDGSGAHLQALGFQLLVHLQKQTRAKIVGFQQTTELQQRSGIGYTPTAKINSHEPPQRGAVQQGFLAGLIGKIEPVLHEIHPQHPFQSHRGAALAGLGIVRCDHRAQGRPRHQRLHPRQEHIAPGRATMLFKAALLVR